MVARCRNVASARAGSRELGSERDEWAREHETISLPWGWQASRRRAAEHRELADLQTIKPVIKPAALEQFPVRAAFQHLPVMQDEDLVGIHDGAQPVRDGDGRPAPHQLSEGALDLRLDLTVHGARRLVEQEQGG